MKRPIHILIVEDQEEHITLIERALEKHANDFSLTRASSLKDANNLINKKKPDIILVCGDFGWWPKFYPIDKLKPQDTKIYWCPGNHEDWWDLRDNWDKKDAPCEVKKNVY